MLKPCGVTSRGPTNWARISLNKSSKGEFDHGSNTLVERNTWRVVCGRPNRSDHAGFLWPAHSSRLANIDNPFHVAGLYYGRYYPTGVWHTANRGNIPAGVEFNCCFLPA